MDYDLFAQRFKNARLIAGLTQAELAQKMKGSISPKTIPKYESGETMPKVMPFYLMCQGLDISPDYFFIPFRPEIAKLEFRKPLNQGQRKNKSIELQVADTVERSLNIEETMEMAMDFHNPLQDFTVSVSEDVEKAVDLLWEQWRLGSHVLHHVIATLELQLIRIIEVEADPRLDALAGLADGRLPFIVVNRDLDLEGKRVAALRELGHLALQFPKEMPQGKRDRLCGCFARAMLMPRETFLKAIGPAKRKKVSLQELIVIRETYGIDLQSIMLRAQNLGLIRQFTYKAFRKFLAAVKEGTDLGAYRGKEEPVKVKQLVYRATAEGIINEATATDILNTNYRRFQEEFITF